MTPTVPDCRRGHPAVRSCFRTAAPRILEAAVIPTLLFTVAAARFGVRAAIAVSMVYAYGLVAWHRRTRSRPSGMLTVTCTMLTVRAVASLALNSGHLFFGVPVIETFGVAAMFLVSLRSTTPLVVRMAGDLAPQVADRLADPACRQLAVRLSIVWSVVHAGIALTTVYLLTHESLSVFVWIKILNGWSWMGLGAVMTLLLTRPILGVVRPVQPQGRRAFALSA